MQSSDSLKTEERERRHIIYFRPFLAFTYLGLHYYTHSSNYDAIILIEGRIPWDIIVAMIKHRGLKVLRLGQNQFEDHGLPPVLDLNGLKELDLSSIESLGGKIIRNPHWAKHSQPLPL
jgi:hypothetical protein